MATVAVRASADAGSGISEADAAEIAPVELGDEELALNIFTFALGINRCLDASSTWQPMGSQWDTTWQRIQGRFFTLMIRE